MRTLDARGAPARSLTARLFRDAKLLLSLGRMLSSYATRGALIRRRYRRLERRGGVYWLDDAQVPPTDSK